MEINNNVMCMTRCDNITYKAPKFHVRGFVEYFLWKDEFNEKYIQIVSNKIGNDISLGEDYYLFSISQYNRSGVFLGSIWGLDRNLELKKIKNINILFMLKTALQYYNQLEIKHKL